MRRVPLAEGEHRPPSAKASAESLGASLSPKARQRCAVREISSAQAYGETTEAVTSSKNTKYPVPAGIKFPKITFSLSPFKKSFFLYNAA